MKFNHPAKLIKSESITTCRQTDLEFSKTHPQYIPYKIGQRTIKTTFPIETRLL